MIRSIISFASVLNVVSASNPDFASLLMAIEMREAEAQAVPAAPVVPTPAVQAVQREPDFYDELLAFDLETPAIPQPAAQPAAPLTVDAAIPVVDLSVDAGAHRQAATKRKSEGASQPSKQFRAANDLDLESLKLFNPFGDLGSKWEVSFDSLDEIRFIQEDAEQLARADRRARLTEEFARMKRQQEFLRTVGEA